jgi:hypothetical protein
VTDAFFKQMGDIEDYKLEKDAEREKFMIKLLTAISSKSESISSLNPNKISDIRRKFTKNFHPGMLIIPNIN